MTVWRAELFEDNEYYLALPGQIASIDKNNQFVVVITGNGKIQSERIGISWGGNSESGDWR